MSYAEAKARYAAIGVDTEAAIARLKTVPISLHCWQGDDVRGFDTDPTKPLTGGIQTTGQLPRPCPHPGGADGRHGQGAVPLPRHQKDQSPCLLRHF